MSHDDVIRQRPHDIVPQRETGREFGDGLLVSRRSDYDGLI